MVHHIGWRRFQDFQRAVHASAKVGGQDFDAGIRRQGAHAADAIGEMGGATVAQVVAVDRCDHHIAELERTDGFCEVLRFVRIERIGTAMADIAERTATRALVAHDHESRSALAKAFADVRAAGFLAHGDELVGAQDILDFIKTRGRRCCLYANPVGLGKPFHGHDLDRNALGLAGAFLFFCGIVSGGRGRRSVVGHDRLLC